MRKEKGYLNKLNLVLVQVSSTMLVFGCIGVKLLCPAHHAHVAFRYSSKHGRKTGPHSSRKLSRPPEQIYPYARTT